MRISCAQEKNLYTLRLKSGDDYIASIIKFVQKERIKSAYILNSIGMLEDIELAFFVGKGKYKINKFKGPLEVISTQGNIATDKEGKLKTHIHLALADKKGISFGGHLEKGIVWVTAEILIFKMNQIKLKRELEKDTGLFGLYFEKN